MVYIKSYPAAKMLHRTPKQAEKPEKKKGRRVCKGSKNMKHKRSKMVLTLPERIHTARKTNPVHSIHLHRTTHDLISPP
jgi:hypothetical protein